MYQGQTCNHSAEAGEDTACLIESGQRSRSSSSPSMFVRDVCRSLSCRGSGLSDVNPFAMSYADDEIRPSEANRKCVAQASYCTDKSNSACISLGTDDSSVNVELFSSTPTLRPLYCSESMRSWIDILKPETCHTSPGSEHSVRCNADDLAHGTLTASVVRARSGEAGIDGGITDTVYFCFARSPFDRALACLSGTTVSDGVNHCCSIRGSTYMFIKATAMEATTEGKVFGIARLRTPVCLFCSRRGTFSSAVRFKVEGKVVVRDVRWLWETKDCQETGLVVRDGRRGMSSTLEV
ncbi:hypothetical protein M747DRAFT_269940, partial [Aspergillus niger ATCC 13496]|uniref:Contig An12c0170, genomic contig n=3 Tax=Aspergillus niger TaxID=5061 RepID=A2QZT6_ASPNC